jgi:hypothetical protein
MEKNLPVSDDVELEFQTYANNLPNGIKNQLLPLQENNPNAVTPAALLRQYNQQQTEYLHALTEGIVPLLVENRKSETVELLNEDGSNWSKQVLAGTYIADDNLNNALVELAQIAIDNDPYLEDNVELMIQLLQLRQNGTSIYNMDAGTFAGIYELATQCPPYPAVYNARAIVEILTGEKIQECPIDENWKMNLTIESNTQNDQSLLGENYPDPFNELTLIPCTIPEGSIARISVTDITGRILYTQPLEAGKHLVNINSISWEAGMYFYTLELDGVLYDTKKMVLVK